MVRPHLSALSESILGKDLPSPKGSVSRINMSGAYEAATRRKTGVPMKKLAAFLFYGTKFLFELVRVCVCKTHLEYWRVLWTAHVVFGLACSRRARALARARLTSESL